MASTNSKPLPRSCGSMLRSRRGRTGPTTRLLDELAFDWIAALRIVSRYATCGLPTFASTLNSRFMRSTMISRCSSPMPAMMVWPDSSSVRTRNDGSSCARRFSAMPIFSWSALVFGSIACGSPAPGNSIRSSMIDVVASHSVSPVDASFETDGRGDVAGAHFLDFLALVRVHLQHAADALLASATRVVARCRPNSARPK